MGETHGYKLTIVPGEPLAFLLITSKNVDLPAPEGPNTLLRVSDVL